MRGFEVSVDNERHLHPYASRSSDSRRLLLRKVVDEKNRAAWRSPYGRDRHRIIHCSAFRRLAHKTQVYLASYSNEHRRTRLTHTLEVASIARDIARVVRANEDLVEGIAFGHDIGHAPFGHAGERLLDEFFTPSFRLPRMLMDKMPECDPSNPRAGGFGRFRHNYQSVRVLSVLEDYIPDQPGLNLTVQCLEGIIKHTSILPYVETELARYGFPKGLEPHLYLDIPCSVTIEGQIVAVADEIAQVAHDLSDAMGLTGLDIVDLLDECPALRPAFEQVSHLHGANPPEELWYMREETAAKEQLAPIIINHFAPIAAEAMIKKLDSLPDPPQNGPRLKEWLLPCGSYPSREFEDVKDFKDDLVINNYDVNRMDNKGQFLIRQLIEAYVSDPRQLPDSVLTRYVEEKKSCYKQGGHTACLDWLALVDREIFGNSDMRLTDEQREDIVSALADSGGDGKQLRRKGHKLLSRLAPYLIADADYRRCIADYIAGMSDAFAQDEVTKLYR